MSNKKPTEFVPPLNDNLYNVDSFTDINFRSHYDKQGVIDKLTEFFPEDIEQVDQVALLAVLRKGNEVTSFSLSGVNNGDYDNSDIPFNVAASAINVNCRTPYDGRELFNNIATHTQMLTMGWIEESNNKVGTTVHMAGGMITVVSDYCRQPINQEESKNEISE